MAKKKDLIGKPLTLREVNTFLDLSYRVRKLFKDRGYRLGKALKTSEADHESFIGVESHFVMGRPRVPIGNNSFTTDRGPFTEISQNERIRFIFLVNSDYDESNEWENSPTREQDLPAFILTMSEGEYQDWLKTALAESEADSRRQRIDSIVWSLEQSKKSLAELGLNEKGEPL